MADQDIPLASILGTQDAQGVPLSTLPQAVHPTSPRMLDYISAFLHGGLHGVARTAGVQTPAWSDRVAGVLQNPNLNTAIGMASPVGDLATAWRTTEAGRPVYDRVGQTVAKSRAQAIDSRAGALGDKLSAAAADPEWNNPLWAELWRANPMAKK